MTVLSTGEFHKDPEKSLDRVADGGEIVLIRHGDAVVALVPTDNSNLLEAIEDYIDLMDARAAKEEAESEGAVPWEEVKAELGL